ERLVNPVEQCTKTDSLRRRDVHSLQIVTQAVPLLGREQINFVLYVQPWFLAGLKLFQNAINLRILLDGKRAAGVGNLQNQRRALYLFERRAKGRNQRVRKAA